MNVPRLREIVPLGRVARSLRFKATVAVASFLVMVSVLLSVLFVVYVERGEREDIRRSAEKWSLVLGEAVAVGVEANESARVEAILTSIRRDPRIAYVCVHGSEGVLAASMERCPAALRDPPSIDPAGLPLGGTQPRYTRYEGEGGPFLDIVAPVRSPTAPAEAAAAGEALDEASRVIGAVHYGISLAASRQRLAELRARVTASTLAMIGLSMIGTMFLVGTIVGPIQELAGATRRIAEGDLDIRMHSASNDEIGILTRSFNEMAEQLRENRRRQQGWSQDLEARVREKTREIEETRQHLADVVENVGASILVADLDGTIISANTHTMHIFGTKPEWTVGRSIDEFTCDPEHDFAAVRGLLYETAGPVVYEARHEPPGSPAHDLLITHTLLRGSNGDPGGILQITKDVTPLKRMEHRLVTSERLSAMGEMAGEIGHELNNYLMAIGGRAEMITMALDRGLDEGGLSRTRRSAEIISRQVAEMRALTDGLLESARKESCPSRLDLNELVRGTLDFVRPQNRYDRIRFEAEMAPAELLVWADPQQIRQVMLNLLANAADAILEKSPAGGTIRIETLRDRDQVGFRVTDDGPGIDEETRKRIFEPHFTTKEKGHGFGLAVCHRVVANHGGRITVDSRPNEGTSFRVDLDPLRSPSAEASQPTSA